MTTTFTVDLVTAEGIVLSTEAQFLRAPGIDGDLGVLAHHVPLLTPLRTGELLIQTEDEEVVAYVAGGFLAVMPGRVIVLADAAERAPVVDAERAQAARRWAERMGDQDHLSAQAVIALERSMLHTDPREVPRRRRRRTTPPQP